MNRRLVPTRWAITAVDDSLGKHLREEVQDYPQSEFKFFFGGYLGNYYLILFFSDLFRYELFEMNTRSGPEHYATDYENHKGRSSYAEETAGGYYASRYPILQKLCEEREQASVLVLRFITPEYTAPLGVWVVREATRKSLAAEPVFAGSRAELLEKARVLVQEKVGVDIDRYLKASRLLEEISSQSKISSFF